MNWIYQAIIKWIREFNPARVGWQICICAIIAPLIGNTVTGIFYSEFVLSNRGLPATATVVELTPENHGTYQYAFDVKGKRYIGAGRLNLKVSEKIGDKIEITYFSDNPEISSVGERSSISFVIELLGLGVYSLVFMGIAIWLRSVDKKRQAKKPVKGT